MTGQEVKIKLYEYGLTWEGFAQWMIGQTSPSGDEETIYFKYDVDTYIYGVMGKNED